MPATALFLECKSYVIVGIYASISGFLLMCGDVQFSGRPVKYPRPVSAEVDGAGY